MQMQRRAAAGGPRAAQRRAHLQVRCVASVSKPAVAPSTNSKASSLTPEVAKDLYYDMVMGREFEEMCAQMYYRGKMFGFVHLYSGQEAVSSGVIRALRASDYVCSTYRDHVHAISKGVTPRCVGGEPRPRGGCIAALQAPSSGRARGKRAGHTTCTTLASWGAAH